MPETPPDVFGVGKRRMTQQQVTHAFVTAFIEEMARSGVRHVCVCPGSRSTPLAMLLEQHPAIKIWMHVDERSASFFGLGLAKRLGETVALLCTSGTAAAEFYPAVIEARYGRVPLLVLTADRPPELRDNGAPQTIDQNRLYGDHVKWFADVGLPEATTPALRSVRTIACRAVATTLDAPAGPVHLNFPFREPLVPLPGLEPDDLVRPSGQPYVAVPRSRRRLDSHVIETLTNGLRQVERGLIVCGQQADEAFPSAVAALADTLGFPILADPLSGVRCGLHDRSMVIDSYDAFLRDERVVERLTPEVVLRFGAMPASKPLLQFLERPASRIQAPATGIQAYEPRQIIVDEGAGWRDPTLAAGEMLWADPVDLCREIAGTVRGGKDTQACGGVLGPSPTGTGGWIDEWRRIDRVTRQAIETLLAGMDEPFEGMVFADLAEVLPAGSTLYAGSSMPVRDLDTFFPGVGRPIRFLSNRGANGIDGVVSSALGAAAAGSPVYLAIGDLSFYHDLNGLLAAKRHSLDLTIVLSNNDGGGIFSFLPQATQADRFETLFGTPTGLDFGAAVRMYGGTFERVTSGQALRQALGSCGGLRVIEVVTDRARNVALHREVWGAVANALRDAMIPEGVS